MIFSTILFLFRFLPITLALSYLAPAKLKNLALFLCSLVFYSWGEVKFFPVMVVLILINYTCGLLMEKFDHSVRARRVLLVASIVGSLSMLVFFKYSNFLIGTVNSLFGLSIGLIEAATVLPLGISFYTFQTMSYSIDVYRRDVPAEHRQSVTKCLSRIDISTILFFLGILLAVGSLSEIGVLQALGQWLDKATGGNDYLITGAIGFVSSVVDNVPLVAGAMKMYVIDPASANLAVDGIFWQLLAYCAGVGGSMLIIGSAAGVVVMGLEKITFGWYLRHISWVVVIGYLSGIVTYWLMRTVF